MKRRLTVFLGILLVLGLAVLGWAEIRRTPLMGLPRLHDQDEDEAISKIDDYLGSMTNGGNVRYTRWFRDLPTLSPPLPMSRDGRSSDDRSVRPVEVLCLDCVPGSNPAAKCACTPECGLDRNVPCECEDPCGTVCVNDGRAGTPGPGVAPNAVGWRCDLNSVTTTPTTTSTTTTTIDVCAIVADECPPGGGDCAPPYCNVKCYGAVGDGVTDDTAAIQAAADACAVSGWPGPFDDPELTYDPVTHSGCQGGGTVFFPRTRPGYKVTDTIVGCGVSFLGENVGGSAIIATDFGSCSTLRGALNQCDPVLEVRGPDNPYPATSGTYIDSYPRVAELTFLGPDQTVPMASWGSHLVTTDAIHFSDVTVFGYSVDHVHIAGFDTGILIPLTNTRGTIRRSTLENNFSHITFGSSGDGVVIAENSFGEAHWDAFGLFGDLAGTTIRDVYDVIGVPYFLYGAHATGTSFLHDVEIANVQKARVCNGFIFAEAATTSGKGQVLGLRLRNIGEIEMDATCKIAAKAADYNIVVGQVIAGSTWELDGRNTAGTLNALDDGAVGRIYINDLQGTVRVQTSPLMSSGITVAGGKPWQLLLCDDTGLCLPFATATTTSLDTTPTVAGMSQLTVTNGSGTTITQLDDGRLNQRVTLRFTDTNTTINDGGNFKLTGNFVSTADDTLTLLYDGTSWVEVARAVN